MVKCRNKYRIDAHRRPDWDYSANGIYFITLVTQHRIHHLGKIMDAAIRLSDFGRIVETEWMNSFEM